MAVDKHAQDKQAQETRNQANRAEPSWGRVLANTIQLWAARRLSRPVRGHWRLIALVVVLGIGTGAALGFTGVFNGSKGQAHAQMTARSTPSDDPAAPVRRQAAAWVASQVGAN